ncbi:Starch-binding associating with outer membrane [Mucilaginibacter sp. OK268]|uniref:SusD/RagB family nutrient-binding outer membrane lipoprotein n=1 Tax=Mucilaginibacter sp. OK268 TaxID=1881048 RepID=UPI00088C3A62|nr:SusD/RagB family nutrient-binding outer membrane lipoprotein [Mucilaginibacter sp. OK268]SDP82176.1 Starch-binding associating with outer membrane [Mucilaginibacter sp. OK268]
MKKNIYKVICAVMLFAIVQPSCKKDFESINTDPNTSPTTTPKQLLAPALVNVLTANMLQSRKYNNELMQVTVNQSDSEGQVFRYDIKNTWGDYTWNNWYLQLTNFKSIYDIAGQPVTLNKGYQGISLICQAWIYSMLTDTYGDVPYSQSNQGKDLNFQPAFDKQKDIYQGIFKQLEDANTLLTGAVNVAASSDPVFNGNTTLWRKFGNSLYLRLLLRISGKAEVSADCIAKIKDVVDNNPSTYPIMASNAESAVIKWTGSGYLTSPFIAGVRAQDFTAPSLCSFFIDNLTKWADPRLFGNSWAIATYGGGYVGVPSGYAPGNAPIKKSYFYSTTSTKTLMNEPLMGNIMNYAELQFILAEAAAKGWISTPAKTYYDNGVINAITFWQPNFTTPVATYETTADITWDDSLPLDDKMEMIHVQKYYTLFWTDFEQWFEYRRTGHPILPKGAGLLNGGVMPARIVYPVYVQSANPTNYKAAVASQGPDLLNTQVWWQKP